MSQFPWRLVIALLAASVAFVALTGLAAHQLDKPFGFFSREPSEVVGEPWYMGSLFLIALLIWFASAVVCFFAGALIAQRDGRDAALPLLAAGVICLILSVDDALRIHEDLIPGKLGVPKAVPYAGYVVLIGAWLYYFRDFILQTEWRMLAIAAVLLSISVGIDRAFESNQQHVLEDGFKFLGIVIWTAYFAHTAYRRALGERAAAPATATQLSASASPPRTA